MPVRPLGDGVQSAVPCWDPRGSPHWDVSGSLRDFTLQQAEPSVGTQQQLPLRTEPSFHSAFQGPASAPRPAAPEKGTHCPLGTHRLCANFFQENHTYCKLCALQAQEVMELL